jgi:hypothetical protein
LFREDFPSAWLAAGNEKCDYIQYHLLSRFSKTPVNRAGKLTKIPRMVEAEATKPVQSVEVPRLNENGFKTGLLAIVELRIANRPIMKCPEDCVPSFFCCI